MVTIQPFGTYQGRMVKAFNIQQDHLCVRLLEYGATVQQLLFDGIDCVLGYDTLQDYRNGKSFQGATVGRYANRIGGAAFPYQGGLCQVDANEAGKNALHGGATGFAHRLYQGKVVDDAAVAFTIVSPHGEGGYPGSLTLQVTFRVSADTLQIDYNAVADRDTIMNFTNHAYFTLGADSIIDTRLCIKADAYTPIDRELIPTGEICPVAGTPFDFRQPKAIGRDIFSADAALQAVGGYDHNFVLGTDRRMRENVITAFAPQTGIELTCSTDMPGVQLYTANSLQEPVGKQGRPLTPHTAFCLETQFFPDTPNQPDFPSCFVKAEQPFASSTYYRFVRK